MLPSESHTLSRRDLLKLGAGTAVLAATGMRPAHAAANGAGRPHILFIMADQFRGDCVGADGNKAIRTPNLDRIAHEGVRFSCAYSSTPTCTPARAALLSGLSPWRHGMLGYGKVAEKYPVEMPQALRDAGYYTMGIGKMHWHPQRNPHGFHKVLLDEAAQAHTPEFRSDYISWFMSEAPNLQYDVTGVDWNSFETKAYALPERLHPTHWTGETAVKFIDSYEQAEPFFLKVSFHRPHSPYDPPERFMKMYEDAELPPAAVGDWAQRYAPRSDNGRNIWHGDLGAEQVRRSRQGYYGSVSFVDEEIGRILASLERRGWLDNTLVVFTADHGDMTGDHHLWRKSYAYEASARIPMLMRWPAGLIDAERGQVRDHPVELRDVLPTLLAAAGTHAEGLDGQSMLEPVANPACEWRPWIDLEHDICYDPSNHWNALTDGKWKYVFHARTGEEQLFHLQTDPHERTDLARDANAAHTLQTWRQRLVEHLRERGEAFVKDGVLVPRPERMLYSPNYPGEIPAKKK
ncbi:MAG: arylsulfatase [FCB group bacterium]|jgi:choline-sulfatase|nr:arylsulfatase [FCB group bacterium]